MDEETEAQGHEGAMLEGLGPMGQTVVFRVPSSLTFGGNLVWADRGQSREGEVPRCPCCPPRPEARWVLSWLSAPLSGPVPCFGPRWAGGGEGGAGELGSC